VRSSIISVAYGPSVNAHHARRWTLTSRETGTAVLQAA
jgi:hypothetical protein